MIFNPLFLSDNGSSQILSPKSNKLSNNKYLFSDIVKVVMNPAAEKVEVNENVDKNISVSNIGFAFNGDKIPSDIKLKFVSDIEDENSEKSLTEILPEEIANLILNSGEPLNNDQVVSYISQEPLVGELQGFINGLVGKDALEGYLSENSGLLLKLEDSKSAVNLELVKETGNINKNDKIIVQTLVVPEKTKLFSILGQNINGNADHPLIADGGESNLSDVSKLSLNNPEDPSKPRLSVYSFKYEGQISDLKANNINLKENSAFNLSLIKGNGSNSLNNAIKNIDIEKVSFIPKEIEGNSKSTVESLNNDIKSISVNETKISTLKNINLKSDSDFNVNKITILKKQSSNNLESNNNTKKSNLTRLDFLNSRSQDSKNILRLSKEGIVQNLEFKKELNHEQNKGNLKVNIKSVSNSQDNVDKINNKSIDKTDTKIDLIQLKTNSQEGLKSKNNIADKQSRLEYSDKGNTSANIKSELGKTNTSENVKIVEQANAESRVNVIKENLKSSDKSITGEKIKFSDKVDLNKSEESTKQPTVKNENQFKMDSQKSADKRPISDQEFKNIAENNQKIEKEISSSDKNKGQVFAEAKSSEGKEMAANEIKEDNKISIKVKNSPKTVNDKVASENRLESDNSKNQDKSSGDGFEKTGNSILKNNSISDQLNAKTTFDNSLNQAINKVENAISDNAVNKTAEVENPQNLKIVKSVEVIKEISQFISKQEKGTLSFDIKPESLGKMKITLDTADHAIKARIDVDNEHARQLIERNLGKLQEELAANGIQLSSLNISLGYSRQQRDGNQINNKNMHSESQGQVGETIENEEQKRTLGYNTYEYIA